MADESVRKVDEGPEDEIPDGVTPEEGISLRAARTCLGDLVIRAGVLDERIVITRNGKQAAALIGIRDLERLRAFDQSAPSLATA